MGDGYPRLRQLGPGTLVGGRSRSAGARLIGFLLAIGSVVPIRFVLAIGFVLPIGFVLAIVHAAIATRLGRQCQ